MKLLTSHVLPALVLVSSTAANPAAQSLVEVARQERLRREALARQSGPEAALPRVYTDADLVYSGRLTMRVDDAETDAPGEPGAPETGSEAPPPEAEAAGDEQRWRNRMAEARQALDEAERRATELQTRVNRLWADFTGRDDPAQRAAIEQERQAALAELEETEAEADELAQAIADLRDEARRAGVPPGWLR
jgi:DNA repair exonuclease SbcCD ATPase subunit